MKAYKCEKPCMFGNTHYSPGDRIPVEAVVNSRERTLVSIGLITIFDDGTDATTKPEPQPNVEPKAITPAVPAMQTAKEPQPANTSKGNDQQKAAAKAAAKAAGSTTGKKAKA